MIRWLNTLLGNRIPTQSVPATVPPQATAPAALPTGATVDIAHAAMQSNAVQLSQLVADGVPMMRRRERRERARRKVLSSLRLPVGEDVIDEVTERIVEGAEFDPRIAKWIE